MPAVCDAGRDSSRDSTRGAAGGTRAGTAPLTALEDANAATTRAPALFPATATYAADQPQAWKVLRLAAPNWWLVAYMLLVMEGVVLGMVVERHASVAAMRRLALQVAVLLVTPTLLLAIAPRMYRPARVLLWCAAMALHAALLPCVLAPLPTADAVAMPAARAAASLASLVGAAPMNGPS
jgi:hypothetical protein